MTPSPRGARPFPTAAVGGMETTLFSANTASPSATNAERVGLQDQRQKCDFHCFLMEDSQYICVTLFRWSSQEHPHKEEKHQLHNKPPNLNARNLCSHLHLCGVLFRFLVFFFIATMLRLSVLQVQFSCISMTKNVYVLLQFNTFTRCTGTMFHFTLDCCTTVMARFS